MHLQHLRFAKSQQVFSLLSWVVFVLHQDSGSRCRLLIRHCWILFCQQTLHLRHNFGLYFLYLVAINVLGFEPGINKRSHIQQVISDGILICGNEVIENGCLHCFSYFSVVIIQAKDVDFQQVKHWLWRHTHIVLTWECISQVFQQTQCLFHRLHHVNVLGTNASSSCLPSGPEKWPFPGQSCWVWNPIMLGLGDEFLLR